MEVLILGLISIYIPCKLLQAANRYNRRLELKQELVGAMSSMYTPPVDITPHNVGVIKRSELKPEDYTKLRDYVYNPPYGCYAWTEFAEQYPHSMITVQVLGAINGVTINGVMFSTGLVDDLSDDERDLADEELAGYLKVIGFSDHFVEVMHYARAQGYEDIIVKGRLND